jgi:branched-chain amino acid transport system permease protein
MSLPLQQFFLFTAVYILLSWGLYLPYKLGQLSFSPAYCMAAGAYVTAYAANNWHWHFLLTLVAAVLLGALLAFLPALGLRRAPGFATAIASIALIIIVQTTIRNWRAIGGAAGIFGIPRVPYLLAATAVLVVIVGVLIHRVDHSRVGRATEALTVDRDVAASLGVSMSAVSLSMQAAAGALGGLAGMVYAYTVGSVFPAAFGLSVLMMMAAPMFVGGSATLWGVVVVTPVLWGLPLVLPSRISDWRDIVVGGLLIVVLLVRPEGLISRRTVSGVGAALRRVVSAKGGGSRTGSDGVERGGES